MQSKLSWSPEDRSVVQSSCDPLPKNILEAHATLLLTNLPQSPGSTRPTSSCLAWVKALSVRNNPQPPSSQPLRLHSSPPKARQGNSSTLRNQLQIWTSPPLEPLEHELPGGRGWILLTSSTEFLHGCISNGMNTQDWQVPSGSNREVSCCVVSKQGQQQHRPDWDQGPEERTLGCPWGAPAVKPQATRFQKWKRSSEQGRDGKEGREHFARGWSCLFRPLQLLPDYQLRTAWC